MDPRAEHVWLTDVKTPDGKPWAGLLLGWRKRKGRWEGWVVSASLGYDPDSGPTVREGWVDEASISRLDASSESVVWKQGPVNPAHQARPATAPPPRPS